MNTDQKKAAIVAKANQAAKALAELLHAIVANPTTGQVSQTPPHPFSNMTHSDWRACVRQWREHGLTFLENAAPRPCPACGSCEHTYLFESYDGYQYVECDHCGCWYVPKVISGDLFEQYFKKVPSARKYGDYTQAQFDDESAIEADSARFSGYYEDIAALFANRRGLRTLDIGCGVGNSLISASELGFEASGVEVNKNAIRVGQERGLKVSPSESIPTDEKFDAVTSWEALEHISDPLAVLKTAAQKLSEDGVIAFTVPNLDSPTIRAMRGDSLQIHGGPAWPGHINLFNLKTIDILLERAGLIRIDAVGQFSMNFSEMLAYASGGWSGANDYISSENSTMSLPAISSTLAEAFSTLVPVWEQMLCFAPILFVLARKKDGIDPSGLEQLRQQRMNKVNALLESHYGIVNRSTTIRRGEKLRTDPEFKVPEFIWLSDKGHYTGEADSYAYLWKSPMLHLSAQDQLKLRGKLYCGGVTFGLQSDDAWTMSHNICEQGCFEITLPVEHAGHYKIVIANCVSVGGPTDVDFDCLEYVRV